MDKTIRHNCPNTIKKCPDSVKKLVKKPQVAPKPAKKAPAPKKPQPPSKYFYMNFFSFFFLKLKIFRKD